MDYRAEQQAWIDQVNAWLGSDAMLLSVSKYSSDIRVYKVGDRAVKMRRLTPASVFNRPNSLEDEYLMLRWLRERSPKEIFFPLVLTYTREGAWEMMEMQVMETPAAYDPVVEVHGEAMGDVLAVARAVWRLNRLGISHGDLVRSNIGRTQTGRVVLLDFDQAVIGWSWKCSLRDFLGVPLAYRAALYTVWDRAWEARGLRRLSGVWQKLRKRMAGSSREQRGNPLMTVNRCRASGDSRLMQLAEAWELAAAAGANSPDDRIAYYSWDIAGINFPGERPWVLRWEIIRRQVHFEGKKLVELGCNMGLLSLHACLAGAAQAMAADHNAKIIEAAQKIAAVFAAPIVFRRVDFDQGSEWEATLGEGDVVTALSLTYWLKDKERLWRYLARFPEVIFEGHEPAAEVEDRFATFGYASVTRLGVSERNRVVFYAKRE